MNRERRLAPVVLATLALGFALSVGSGSRVFAQGNGNKGKGKTTSADVPLCIYVDSLGNTARITGDGSQYCASERRTAVKFQIDNGSNDLILNLGTSTKSRVFDIDLSIPEPDSVGLECPVAAEDVFFPQKGFFFNVDQVASVPITEPDPGDPAEQMALDAFCEPMNDLLLCPKTSDGEACLCGEDWGGNVFARRRAKFRLLADGALKGTGARLHFRPMDDPNTSVDAMLVDDPEGTLVYVPGVSSRKRLVWVDRDGTEHPATKDIRNYWSFRISPDGSRIAATVVDDRWSRNVWIYDAKDDWFRQFTLEGEQNVSPIWTPDGEAVVFSSDRDGPFNLYRQPVDGSGPAERLTTTDRPQRAGDYSPDGRVLLFHERTKTRGVEIGTLDILAGGEPQPFIASPGSEYLPVFSPDGR